jgi:hypothetical protein
MKKVMQPFKAPRRRKEPSSPKDQASPEVDDVSNSEGPSELVCSKWVIPETQEANIIQPDLHNDAITTRDKMNGNGQRWTFEARMERSPVAHASKEASQTARASPNILEFETYLEHDLALRQPLQNGEASDKRKRKKQSKNDAFWEGILASEKLRIHKLNDNHLTSVDAMMVGVSSEEDNSDTPSLHRATKRRTKENSTSFPKPSEALSGASPRFLYKK